MPSENCPLFLGTMNARRRRLVPGSTIDPGDFRDRPVRKFMIGMSLFFSYVMSNLHISHSAAQGTVVTGAR